MILAIFGFYVYFLPSYFQIYQNETTIYPNTIFIFKFGVFKYDVCSGYFFAVLQKQYLTRTNYPRAGKYPQKYA